MSMTASAARSLPGLSESMQTTRRCSLSDQLVNAGDSVRLVVYVLTVWLLVSIPVASFIRPPVQPLRWRA